MGKLRQACEARSRPPESREPGANGDLRPGSFFTTLGIVRGRVGLNIVRRFSAVSPSLRETSGGQTIPLSQDLPGAGAVTRETPHGVNTP
jgi:hypothetical protein